MRLPVSDTVNEAIRLRLYKRQEEIISRIRRDKSSAIADASRRGLMHSSLGHAIEPSFAMRQLRELEVAKIQVVIGVLHEAGIPFGANMACALAEDIGVHVEGLRKRIPEIVSQPIAGMKPQESLAGPATQEGERILEELSAYLNREVQIELSRSRLQQGARETAAYATIREVELALRFFIREQMSRVDADWTKRRVSEQVGQRWTKRLGDLESKAYPWLDRDVDAFDMADFADYADIISRKDNWTDVFKPLLRKREEVLAELYKLQALRNQIAHMRGLSEEASQALDHSSADILRRLADAQSASSTDGPVPNRKGAEE